MKNTYLYFAKAAGTLELLNQSSQDIQITTDLTDPVPPGTDAPKLGVFQVEVTSVTSNMTFGSAYDVSGRTGQKVKLNIEDYTYHASNGTLSIPTVASDAVNGFTKSSTAGENDYTITMLRHIDPSDAVMYPASNLRGIQVKDNNETHLYFDALTGDANDVDTVTLTHAVGAHELLAQNLNDAIQRPENQGKVIVFADILANEFFNGNPATISGVAFTLDT